MAKELKSKCYLFDRSGMLLTSFDSVDKCAEFLGVKPFGVYHSISRKSLFRKCYYISFEPEIKKRYGIIKYQAEVEGIAAKLLNEKLTELKERFGNRIGKNRAVNMLLCELYNLRQGKAV